MIFFVNDEFFDLTDRDHGEGLQEEQEPHTKPAEAADENGQLNRANDVETPGAGDEFTGQRSDDDDVALEPHPEVDEEAEHEQEGQIRTQPLDPQKLRKNDVERDHAPRREPIRPK